MFDYFVRIGDALSQLLNVLVYPQTGQANHSLSGDAYRFKRKVLMYVIDLVDSPFERDHCQMAHSADVSRAAKLLNETGRRV